MKYYLIEKWTEYDQPCLGRYASYDVREFDDIGALKAAFLKGPKHEDGQLFPAKGLEYRIELILSEPTANGPEAYYNK